MGMDDTILFINVGLWVLVSNYCCLSAYDSAYAVCHDVSFICLPVFLLSE